MGEAHGGYEASVRGVVRESRGSRLASLSHHYSGISMLLRGVQWGVY